MFTNRINLIYINKLDLVVGWLVVGWLVVGWLVVGVLWHINPCRLFNAKSIFIQSINSILNNSV